MGLGFTGGLVARVVRAAGPGRQGGGRAGRLPEACWFHGRVGGGKVLFVLVYVMA
jgi:hypothetical protein